MTSHAFDRWQEQQDDQPRNVRVVRAERNIAVRSLRMVQSLLADRTKEASADVLTRIGRIVERSLTVCDPTATQES